MSPDEFDRIQGLVLLIRKEFVPQRRFTADDVYCHGSEPLDEDMYIALGIMVKKGELVDVNDVHRDTPLVLTHNDMIYEVPA